MRWIVHTAIIPASGAIVSRFNDASGLFRVDRQGCYAPLFMDK
jgi:hypothetical protein